MHTADTGAPVYSKCWQAQAFTVDGWSGLTTLLIAYICTAVQGITLCSLVCLLIKVEFCALDKLRCKYTKGSLHNGTCHFRTGHVKKKYQRKQLQSLQKADIQ